MFVSWENWIVHAELPAVSWENNSPVRHRFFAQHGPLQFETEAALQFEKSYWSEGQHKSNSLQYYSTSYATQSSPVCGDDVTEDKGHLHQD